MPTQAQRHIYYLKYREHIRKYFLENKEKIREYQAQYSRDHRGTYKDKNTARCRKYRSTTKGKEAVRRANSKYQMKNLLRSKAWDIAQRLIPRTPCIVCGDPNTHRHHPDITRPLEVVMLCSLHHKRVGIST